MKRLRLLPALLLLLPGLAVLAEEKVDFATDVDFASYQTYEWREGVPARSGLMQRILQDHVESELQQKGLRPAGEMMPDLLVYTYVRVEAGNQVDISAVEYKTDFSDWKTPGEVDLGGVNVGTIIVDLVDAESGELAWRGVATETPAHKTKKNDKIIRKAMKRLFKKYPPAP
jgi:hypothetical protein